MITNESLTLLYETHLSNNLKSKPKHFVHLCSNSEFFSRQKVDLLAKCILLESSHSYVRELLEQSDFHYVCVGSIKTSEAATQSISSSYLNREEYFRIVSNQRQIVSDSLNETNIHLLTRCSIVFDMLSTHYAHDINKFKPIDTSEMKANNSDLKEFEESSFVVYSCARINAILEKFASMIEQGIYKEPLPDMDQLNFYALLKHDLEKKLCHEYLFKYDDHLKKVRDLFLLKNKQKTINNQ